MLLSLATPEPISDAPDGRSGVVIVVRRAHFIDAKSIKQICGELRAPRNWVRKVIRSGATAFTYDRTTQPRPKIDP